MSYLDPWWRPWASALHPFCSGNWSATLRSAPEDRALLLTLADGADSVE